MSYFAVKEMLQKSLNVVFCQISLNRSNGRLSSPLGDFPVPLGANLWPSETSLHLRRHFLAVQYVSPLPLQLAAHFGQPAAVVSEVLIEQLQQLWHSPAEETALTTSNLPHDGLPSLTVAGSLFYGIDLVPQASGQLDLRLRPSALRGWLAALTAPEVGLPAWPPAWATGDLLLPQAYPLSTALRLSPLALLQHTHGRSGALLFQSLSPQSLEPQNLNHQGPNLNCLEEPSPILGGQQENWSPATQKVVWALVDVIDTLADADARPQHLGRQSCFLCEVFYQWAQHLYQERAVDSSLATLILRAVHYTLRHLLENRLGSPLLEAG